MISHRDRQMERLQERLSHNTTPAQKYCAACVQVWILFVCFGRLNLFIFLRRQKASQEKLERFLRFNLPQSEGQYLWHLLLSQRIKEGFQKAGDYQ